MKALLRRDFLRLSAATALAVSLAGGPRAWAGELPRLKFREIYGKRMTLTDKAKSLVGRRIAIRGYMAPPLKPDLSFFVLTKMPMAVCPFCDNEADWPDDIILVRLGEPFEAIRFNTRIEVTGVLEIGTEIDEETGFVSLLRLVDAEFEPV